MCLRKSLLAELSSNARVQVSELARMLNTPTSPGRRLEELLAEG
jgi:hypothetical protein